MAASFNFSQYIIFEDERVLLRALQNSDAEHLLEISLNEPETWEYALVKGNGKENLINYIQLATTARENKTQFPFIVFDKKLGNMLGVHVFMISTLNLRHFY